MPGGTRASRYPFAQPVRLTADGAVDSTKYGGVHVTAGASATTVYIRHGQLVTDPIMFTYKVPASESRFFPMPGPIDMPNKIYVDMDANTEEATVLFW